MIVYEANYLDFSTAEAAARSVEASGSGCVVKFELSSNPPYHRSLALWSYRDGKWHAYSIFGGTSEKMGEERPREF